MRIGKKGFTLIEVMITASIITLVFGYFMIYFSTEIKQYYSKDNEIELKQDARIAIDRIVTKIRSYNGLTYEPGTNGTGVIYKGTNIIINTTPNDLNGEINYKYDSVSDYGEIRDASGNKIIGNIVEFKIEKQEVGDTDGLLKVTIACSSDKTSEVKKYTTAVRMHYLGGI